MNKINTPQIDGGGHTFDPTKHVANLDGSPRIRSDGTFVIRSPGRAPVSAVLRFHVTLCICRGAEETWATFVELGDARNFAKAKRYVLSATGVARVYAGRPGSGGELLEEFTAATSRPPAGDREELMKSV